MHPLTTPHGADSLSVLVVDGRAHRRANLHTLLNAANQVGQVGEAATGRETLEMLEQGGWDLVLADLWLADTAGWGLCGHIRATWPQVQVLLMGDADGAIYRQPSAYAGAAGYVNRAALPEQLDAALTAVTCDQTFFNA